MIKQIDKAIVWTARHTEGAMLLWLSSAAAGLALILWVGYWAFFAAGLALACVMLICAMQNWRQATIEWSNSMARETVAVDMLIQLLREIEERDPDRAGELARQFVTLSQLAEVSDISEIGR